MDSKRTGFGRRTNTGRRTAVGVLVVVLLASSAVVLGYNDWFPDVPSSTPHANATRIVKEHDLMEGYEDGTFGLYDTMTSAQFARVIERMAPDGMSRAYAAEMLANMTTPLVFLKRVSKGSNPPWWEVRIVTDPLGLSDRSALGGKCLWFRDGLDGELRPHYEYRSTPREHNWCWRFYDRQGDVWFPILYHSSHDPGSEEVPYYEVAWEWDEDEGTTRVLRYHQSADVLVPEYFAYGDGTDKTRATFVCVQGFGGGNTGTPWELRYYSPPCSAEREALMLPPTPAN